MSGFFRAVRGFVHPTYQKKQADHDKRASLFSSNTISLARLERQGKFDLDTVTSFWSPKAVFSAQKPIPNVAAANFPGACGGEKHPRDAAV